MNYIKQLQLENKRKAETIDKLQEQLRHLQSYLYSSKFSHDTTVQVQDVLNRTHEMQSLILECQLFPH